MVTMMAGAGALVPTPVGAGPLVPTPVGAGALVPTPVGAGPLVPPRLVPVPLFPPGWSRSLGSFLDSIQSRYFDSLRPERRQIPCPSSDYDCLVMS